MQRVRLLRVSCLTFIDSLYIYGQSWKIPLPHGWQNLQIDELEGDDRLSTQQNLSTTLSVFVTLQNACSFALGDYNLVGGNSTWMVVPTPPCPSSIETLALCALATSCTIESPNPLPLPLVPATL